MTKLLERAMSAASELSPEAQDEIARVVLLMAADEDAAFELTQSELESLARSREQARRGEFATDEQVNALWAGPSGQG